MKILHHDRMSNFGADFIPVSPLRATRFVATPLHDRILCDIFLIRIGPAD
jgi:hypothetical protein